MRRLKFRRHALLFAVVLCALAMSGCEQKTVNQILADPGRYANREVAVAGTVTRSYSILGKGAYEIDDGTGKLWVVSESGVPRQGAKVGVRGTIRDGFNLGSLIKLPEPVASGLVMMETSHRAR